jgi:Uncharacterized protein related to glutamine synthetase
LGANEAPPAIISIFLGEQLTDILEQIKDGGAKRSKQGGELRIGVSTLPTLPKDTTDRNRTSPFAFTGNKFEFRMVGSSDSIAKPNYILNVIVAETLSQIADKLEKAKDFNSEVQSLIKEIVTKHQKIIFNGNNYSEDWVIEAEKRGLPNIKSMVEASKAMIAKKNVKVFEKHNVLTKTELEARYEIMLESYIKNINIEVLTMLDMSKKDILPAVIKYITDLATSINAVNATGVKVDTSVQSGILQEVSSVSAAFSKKISELEATLEKGSSMHEDSYKQAYFFRYEIFIKMSELRALGDKLEDMVGSTYWPIPTYGELLFKV